MAENRMVTGGKGFVAGHCIAELSGGATTCAPPCGDGPARPPCATRSLGGPAGDRRQASQSRNLAYEAGWAAAVRTAGSSARSGIAARRGRTEGPGSAIGRQGTARCA